MATPLSATPPQDISTDPQSTYRPPDPAIYDPRINYAALASQGSAGSAQQTPAEFDWNEAGSAYSVHPLNALYNSKRSKESLQRAINEAQTKLASASGVTKGHYEKDIKLLEAAIALKGTPLQNEFLKLPENSQRQMQQMTNKDQMEKWGTTANETQRADLYQASQFAKSFYENGAGWEKVRQPQASSGAVGTGIAGQPGTGGQAGLTYTSTPAGTGQTQFASDQQMTSSPEAQQMQQMIDLQNQQLQQQQQALTGAQSQYQQLAQDYASRDETLTGYLEGLGTNEKAALEKQRTQLKASQKEDLMRRGLTSSTALTSALRGVDTMANESLSQLENRLREQKLNYRTQFSGDTLQAQERAAQFAAQVAGTNFTSGQQVATGMASLAQMLSEQRMAGWQNQASLQETAMQQLTDRYSADLGYKSNLYGLAQREASDVRNAQLEKYGIQEQSKLGYANIASGLAQANLGAQSQAYSSFIGSPIAQIQDRRAQQQPFQRI